MSEASNCNPTRIMRTVGALWQLHGGVSRKGCKEYDHTGAALRTAFDRAGRLIFGATLYRPDGTCKSEKIALTRRPINGPAYRLLMMVKSLYDKAGQLVKSRFVDERPAATYLFDAAVFESGPG